MTKVVNKNGYELDFYATVDFMNDEIREELYDKILPCTEQEFFTAYEEEHEKATGEEWFLSSTNPETAIKIVQWWSNDNTQKTYLSEFLRNYPKAELDESGIPLKICVRALGLKAVKECEAKEKCCAECWNQVID